MIPPTGSVKQLYAAVRNGFECYAFNTIESGADVPFSVRANPLVASGFAEWTRLARKAISSAASFE